MFRIKRLDKLIIKAFIGPFILTLAVVVFILLTQYMLKYFEDFVGKGLGPAVFAELLFYFSLNMVPVALPLAILLSSLMSYGGLGQHHELTAIKGAGISLLRIVMPVFFIATLIAILAFYFNNYIVPEVNLRAYSLLWDIRQKKPTLDIKEGTFYSGLPGYSVKINSKDPDGKTIHDVIIYDHVDGRGNTKVTLADSGKMYTMMDDKYLVLELFKGQNYAELQSSSPSKQEFVRNKFNQSKLVFSLASFDMNRTNVDLFKTNRQMRNIPELEHDIDSMSREQKDIIKGVNSGIRSYFNFQGKSDTIARTMNQAIADSIIQELDTAKASQNEILVNAANQARSVRSLTKSYHERLETIQREENIFKVEVLGKYTKAAACIIMFLIGAPLGAIIKKGGLGIPVLLSIIFFILFYVFTILGEKWAKEGVTNVYVGAWAANAILLLFSFFFLQQARNDAALFELDAYTTKFKKIFKVKS